MTSLLHSEYVTGCGKNSIAYHTHHYNNKNILKENLSIYDLVFNLTSFPVVYAMLCYGEQT